MLTIIIWWLYLCRLNLLMVLWLQEIQQWHLLLLWCLICLMHLLVVPHINLSLKLDFSLIVHLFMQLVWFFIFYLTFIQNYPFQSTNKIGGSILVQLGVIYVPFLQSILQTTSLSLYDLLFIVTISSSIFWIDEARKFFFSERRSQFSYV